MEKISKTFFPADRPPPANSLQLAKSDKRDSRGLIVGGGYMLRRPTTLPDVSLPVPP